MDKRRWINKVKYSHSLYSLYYYIGSYAVRLLGLFVKKHPKRIVFSSFGGRKYDDSPRCIYETMLKDERYKDYEFVWALCEPGKFEIPNAKKIKSDTIAYYKMLMSSSVWVTNSTMERGLSFKPKCIFNLNTWHGTPIKLMGTDIAEENASFKSMGKENHNDIMVAQGQYDVDVFSRVFGIPCENFRIVGLPRNDELVNCNTDRNRSFIRKKIGVMGDKKIILYAPTFREYDKEVGNNCVLMPPINLKKWEKELGDKYVLLIRAHYEVVKFLKFEDNAFVKNVSSYRNLNELMIVSDLLVSDYSSIFFDYSILEKPMLCFAYDYEKYASERGMYFDIREKLQGNNVNEDQLIEAIRTLDIVKAKEIIHAFRNEFIEASGSASIQVVEIIWKYLNGKEF